ncbi:uncharacterized protein LACBIDRAFT_297196 [Laccaria bicolor S238N-H82]|uniref:Predicted protein n=1 Tax=Laccaria bicolor (strain S238N-H82 / ATCC MYA-4686) TaxID=486041 RepID=B0DA82_LACBS|nr:uncharacterized protein LACBIDRAFT_297196 [Laccaria bicolor S238N-H82]EDR08481.1 predicted protein [Laccaria bicolor S238N-H82]|eukprot:XP_001880706.1 predicted protein [Laccaria bicolor S238N-H82]
MRLASLVPSIPIEVVAHLENSGFRTDADVLFTPAFDIFTVLPPKTLSLRDVAELISRVEELASAAAVPANDLLLLDNLAREQDFDLSTGDPQLDANLLGLGGRTVIEISGDRGSGKTAFALNVILHHLTCHPNATAAWIDTTGDFSPKRAIQVLESYAAEAPLAALERLQVSLAFEVEVARGILEELNQLGNLRYIVIDTVTSLLSPLLSAGSSQGHAMMSEFMCNLRTLSQSCGITVLVDPPFGIYEKIKLTANGEGYQQHNEYRPNGYCTLDRTKARTRPVICIHDGRYAVVFFAGWYHQRKS